MKQPIRVAITGPAGQIGYALVFRIASGQMFGPDQPVILQMIEVPVEKAMNALKGVAMELEDCAFPLLHDMVLTDDPNVGFKDSREGILRGAPGESDRALLARLVDDPPANSREGFIALLNAGLPTKRIIAQGLLRDADNRILLCRLTYKPEWDLPGGVVEVGESPADGLVRELQEELGITVQVKGLITVNWLPAWRGWDDACVMLFDLGVDEPSVIDSMHLQPTEIAGVEWCDEETIARHATAAARELLDAVRAGGIPPYRESPKSSID